MPAGRPSGYNLELAKEICQAVRNSVRGLNWLCEQNTHWPERSIVYDWLSIHPEFSDMYAKAKKEQADFLFDETLDVSYNDKLDHKIVEDQHGNERTVVVNEAVNRSRLKVDTLKYCAARLHLRKYGDKADVMELAQEIAELKLMLKGVKNNGNPESESKE